MLAREFYLKDVNLVAQDLLGKMLVHQTKQGRYSGIIVEVEAYNGANDKASHAFQMRKTKRTEIQFGLGGYAYVYLIYGMHHCFNIVTNTVDKPEAVLVRALQPVDGIDVMLARRGSKRPQDTCNGPGKLCQALHITQKQYGEDLCGNTLYLEDAIACPREQIGVSARINIDYAEECKDLPWRYFIKDNPFVSKVPQKYHSDLTLQTIASEN